MSPIRKSRVKALTKLRIFINICQEIMKNYEQLSSTISKFQAFFSKIRALFERFFAMFWALFLHQKSYWGWCGVIELGLRLEFKFLSRFFLFCQNVEHEYCFLTLKIIPAIGKNIFFWTTQHARFFHSICSCVNIFWYFLITFLTIPHQLLLIILFYLGIKSLTRLASYSVRLMALAFFQSH